MTGNLLVTPEKLISTAEEFSSINSQITSLTSNMIETINSLSSTWAGEAATMYNSQFTSLQDDMARIASMINEHVNDLKEMGKNYQTAETTNTQTANALPVDVIS